MTTPLALRTIQDALPSTWAVELDGTDQYGLTIRSGTGRTLTMAAYANRAGALPVPELIAVLTQTQQRTGQPVVYLSNYIGPTARQALASADFNFADETGWLYVRNDDPLILLNREGAAKAPRSAAAGTSPIVRLNGKGANRLICALAMAEPPLGVRELARLANVSPGTATKILTALEAEGIIERTPDKAIAKIYRRALIERWVQDYQFLTTNEGVGLYISRRGILNTFKMFKNESDIAFTGSAAAHLLLPPGVTSITPMSVLSIYTKDPELIASKYRLIPSDATHFDTVIALPQYPEIIYSDHNINVAPLPLVLADLLTLPNRGDAEFAQLIDELFPTDPSWRYSHD